MGPGSTRGLTDGGGAVRDGDPGRAERSMDQGDIHGPEAKGGAADSQDRGGDGGSADRGNNDQKTMRKLEGRGSLVESKRWRIEVQPETQKSVVEAEQRLTEVEPEGRGSPAVELRERRARAELTGRGEAGESITLCRAGDQEA